MRGIVDLASPCRHCWTLRRPCHSATSSRDLGRLRDQLGRGTVARLHLWRTTHRRASVLQIHPAGGPLRRLCADTGTASSLHAAHLWERWRWSIWKQLNWSMFRFSSYLSAGEERGLPGKVRMGRWMGRFKSWLQASTEDAAGRWCSSYR